MVSADRAVADLPFDVLRAERTAARREFELAQLRARQLGAVAHEQLVPLGDRVRELTDELILRYVADPSLVDRLLDPAYSRTVTDDQAVSQAPGTTP